MTKLQRLIPKVSQQLTPLLPYFGMSLFRSVKNHYQGMFSE